MAAFADRVAVVTGAGSGVGKAIAIALAGEGATLCLVGRRLEALEAVAATALLTSSRVRCYRADITMDKDITDLAARVRQDMGGVDMLIHSAGVISLGRLAEARLEEFDWQYRTNVRGPAALNQALLPMLRPRRGHIVFINSTAGHTAKAGVGYYAATKHALKALADSLREEVNADGLRVLSVFIGNTATPMQAAMHEMEGRPYEPARFIQADDVAEMVISALSVAPSAEVTDIHIRPALKS